MIKVDACGVPIPKVALNTVMKELILPQIQEYLNNSSLMMDLLKMENTKFESYTTTRRN